MRINSVRIVFILLFLVVALYLFYLQIIRGNYYVRLSRNNASRLVSWDGPRGRVLDRNGVLIAESIKMYNAVIIPQDTTVKTRKAVFDFLGRTLHCDPFVLERRFDRGRVSSFAPVVVVPNLTREKAILVEESAGLYSGLMVIEAYQRYYPEGDVGAHLLGYTSPVNVEKMRELMNNGNFVPEVVGYTGIEQAYDEKLRGVPGGREVEVNSRGREVRVLGSWNPVPGSDIVLTVDQQIQLIVSDIVRGRRGAFVMIDPDTGEVLSLISSPAFNPNDFSAKKRPARVSEYFNDSRRPLINRAFGAAFPPGSVFKVPLSFGALQEHKISAETVFDCPGYFDFGGRRAVFSHAYGRQNLTEALAHSANEYFFHTGFLLGPEKIYEYAKRFGLGERTGIILPYESKGKLPSLGSFRNWYKGDTANMSIGQGDNLATPLQLARLMAAVENGGRLLIPRVVVSVGGVLENQSNVIERQLIFDQPVWDAVRRGLMAVVNTSSGTAHTLRLEGFLSYGKTGTAQAGAGRADHAWYAGVTRSEKRKVAYCLLLEHGGSSANAVLAVREILIRLQKSGII